MICNIKSFPRCKKLIVIDLDKVSHDAVNAKPKIKHRNQNWSIVAMNKMYQCNLENEDSIDVLELNDNRAFLEEKFLDVIGLYIYLHIYFVYYILVL